MFCGVPLVCDGPWDYILLIFGLLVLLLDLAFKRSQTRLYVFACEAWCCVISVYMFYLEIKASYYQASLGVGPMPVAGK